MMTMAGPQTAPRRPKPEDAAGHITVSENEGLNVIVVKRVLRRNRVVVCVVYQSSSVCSYHDVSRSQIRCNIPKG